MSLKPVYDMMPMPDDRELVNHIWVAFNHEDERLSGLIVHIFDGEKYRERFLCMNVTAMEELARYMKEECERYRNGEMVPGRGTRN